MRVLYPGGFDLLHPGHIAALRHAKRIAGNHGHLTVAVNSDAFMVHYKRKPMHPERKRIHDVIETGIADQVIVWDGPRRQDQQILNAKPDLYIAGADWLAKDLARQLGLPDLEWFDRHHISLLYLARTPGISTTQLINDSHA